MPKVIRRTTKKKTVNKAGGIRDRLRPISENNYGLRMNLYGRGKTGKTTLACDFPKPLLLVGTMGTLEDGTLSVSDIEGIDFFPLEKVEELEEILRAVVEDEYKSIVLDTGGGLQDMILKEHLGLAEIPIQKTWGLAQMQDWQIVGMQCKERFRELLSLSMLHGVHVVIIAHERIFDSGEGNQEGITLTIGSALSPSVAGWLNGGCDYVCQCFIREEIIKKEMSVGNKKVGREVKTGRSEYCLRIGPHPVYLTGFRKPKGVKIPDTIVDPSFQKIISLINK